MTGELWAIVYFAIFVLITVLTQLITLYSARKWQREDPEAFRKSKRDYML